MRTFCRVLVVAVSASVVRAQCGGVPTSATGSVAWNPAWCQEFNATTAGPPDTTVWAFDLGNSGFGNNEIETYCGPPGYAGNPANCPTTFSPTTANEYIDGNGHLILQAINNGGTWYSARMKTQVPPNSQNGQDFQYGRIEASIQLPNTTNAGLWPSFWSLGSDITTTPWPACGETDIMEVWSTSVLNGPGPGGNRSTLHTTATAGPGLQPNGQFPFPSGQANDTAFHTYGMIWSANMQQFYIDTPTQPYYIATASNLSSSDTWPFNAKLFLLTNIAVGGTLGGIPSSSTPNPAVMTYDYVRQYSAASAITAPIMGTPASISVKAGATTGNSSTFTPTPSANTGYVYFSCSTTAPNASCAVQTSDPLNKYVINSAAATAETVTVSVATTANGSASNLGHGSNLSHLVPAILGFPFLIVLPIASRKRHAFFYTFILVLGLILVAATPSCGGGGGGGGGAGANNGTTPGNYTVSVYAFTESNIGNGANSNADAHVDIRMTVLYCRILGLATE